MIDSLCNWRTQKTAVGNERPILKNLAFPLCCNADKALG